MSPRRSSAARSRDGATRSCSRRRCTGTMDDDDPNRRGNSRRWIVEEVENSLRRLRTDWIDLYQIHRWDPWTGHDETLSALTDLQRAGKIRYFGSSTYPGLGDRRGAMGARAARARAVRQRAAALLDPRPRHRGRGPARLRAPRPGRDPVEPARRRLAERPLPPRLGDDESPRDRASRPGTTSRCRATS